MYFMQRTDVIFRQFNSFALITDNRNFSYVPIENEEDIIGDKVLSQSGSIFFSVLKRYPQDLDNLVLELEKQFSEVDLHLLRNDATEFYYMLESEGFIASGETYVSCMAKDSRAFSPSSNRGKHINNSKPQVNLGITTQDFLEKYFDGAPQLTNLHIELTSRCNERCVHCFIPHESKLCDMNSALFDSVLKQCKSMGVLHLTLSGGEPLLHSDFCNILYKCRESNFSVNVLSNLTLLSDEIVKEMKANPLLGVQVSLYSMDAKIHDDITQVKGSHEKTIASILKLVENNIPTQISCPILKQNRDSYSKVVEWAKKRKIKVSDDYVIIAKYNNTKDNLKNRLEPKEVEKILTNLADSNPDFLHKLETEAEIKKSSNPNDRVCSVCQSSICVAENGNVYPCAGWRGFVVGNVKDSSLKQVWDTSETIQYLRGLQNSDFLKCRSCEDKLYCTMCLVRNANEDSEGDPLVVNEYFCEVAKINRRIVLDHEENREK